jgi:hypothetical protein
MAQVINMFNSEYYLAAAMGLPREASHSGMLDVRAATLHTNDLLHSN